MNRTNRNDIIRTIATLAAGQKARNGAARANMAEVMEITGRDYSAMVTMRNLGLVAFVKGGHDFTAPRCVVLTETGKLAADYLSAVDGIEAIRAAAMGPAGDKAIAHLETLRDAAAAALRAAR